MGKNSKLRKQIISLSFSIQVPSASTSFHALMTVIIRHAYVLSDLFGSEPSNCRMNLWKCLVSLSFEQNPTFLIFGDIYTEDHFDRWPFLSYDEQTLGNECQHEQSKKLNITIPGR
jgi:hypothetical protein